MKKTYKTFCVMPWTAIATSPSGIYRPCCRMISNEDMPMGSLNGYLTSNYLNEVKSLFVSGKYPRECSRCKKEDSAGISSKRTRENAKWLSTNNKSNFEDIENASFSLIDMRLSNVCNLFCITCNPISSSSIFNETIKHINDPTKSIEHYAHIYRSIKNDTLNPYSSEEIESIIDCISDNTLLYFTGGEPSLVKPAFRVLEQLIERGINNKVRIQFNSNFQSFNSDWVNLLKHFKGTMMPSLDAIGEQAELIRYGCDWNTVNKNLQRFHDECNTFEIRISPAISVLNFLYIKELAEWTTTFNSERVKLDLTNIVHTPPFLSINNTPDHIKNRFIEYANDLINSRLRINTNEAYNLLRYVKEDSSIKEFDKFIVEMDKFDNLRNTNWRETLNKISDWK